MFERSFINPYFSVDLKNDKLFFAKSAFIRIYYNKGKIYFDIHKNHLLNSFVGKYF